MSPLAVDSSSVSDSLARWNLMGWASNWNPSGALVSTSQ